MLNAHLNCTPPPLGIHLFQISKYATWFHGRRPISVAILAHAVGSMNVLLFLCILVTCNNSNTPVPSSGAVARPGLLYRLDLLVISPLCDKVSSGLTLKLKANKALDENLSLHYGTSPAI